MPEPPRPPAPEPPARELTGPRIGWLGGSFDPVHEGHLAIARAAADAFALQRVLFVPAHRPPHKRDRQLAPDADRLALLEIACATDARFAVHDLELRRGGLSFSHDTAQALLAELPPGARLHAIIGADTLADLPHWRRIADLAALVQFCPVAREGQELDTRCLLEVLGAERTAAIARHCLHLPPHPASATAIRGALASGESPQWLPPGVEEAIRRRGLYGAGGASSSDSDASGDERSRP